MGKFRNLVAIYYATGNYGMTITKGNGYISIYNLSIAHMWSPGGSSISAYPHATIDNYGNLSINSVEFHENYAGVDILIFYTDQCRDNHPS